MGLPGLRGWQDEKRSGVSLSSRGRGQCTVIL